MKKKSITIEDLARMIQKGFEETKGEVVNLEKWSKRRFDNVDEELKNIRKQLTGIVYRQEFEKLETRVKDLEDLLAVVGKKQ
jgi:polyhydroxyalkanoate synthesis regulator phasin